jgi:hypothetical protein
MEYIPDGMSKAQWAALKKKEQDEEKEKSKTYGAIGITKFKSRSFEAWQKSGGKNLFPVDPSTPESERPYMQRKGGMPDGSDLKKKGIKGKGQGLGSALNAADEKYDQLGKEGKLKSTPFTLPWTQKDLENKNKANVKVGAKTAAGKKGPVKRSPAKKAPAKKAAPAPAPVKKTGGGLFGSRKKQAPPPEPEPEPEPVKKKFFGLF